ncbi:MAG: thiol:disulfide interchange protein DsbA/DsbL [Pseudomonadales bacterium]
MLRSVSLAATLVVLIGALLLAGFAVAEAAQATFREGEHFERLPIPVDTRDPAKVEVVEVFSYGCIHCKNFQPAVEAWLETKPEDVDFYRMPATFSEPWEVLAQLYYTAEALGVTGKVHGAIFSAIHDQGVNLTDTDLMAALFEREAGVEPEQFRKVFSSFSVRSRVQQAHARGLAYRLSGTPTLIVDGLYRVDGRMAGGNASMLDVVEFLVAQRRAAATGAE